MQQRHCPSDDRNRLTQTTLPDPDGAGSLTAPVTQWAYDDAGQLTSLTDPVGNVTTWAYDDLGRRTSETNELSDVRSWTYDALGNVLTATDRRGLVTEFSYDNLSRLTQEVWKDGATTLNTIDSTYDVANRLTAIEDDDSAYAYTYDNLGRVMQIDNDGTGTGPGVVLYSTYDVGSRRSSVRAVVDSTDDFINTFAYDDLGRLVTLQQVAQSGGNSVEDKRVDFAYNAASQFSTIDRYADITQTDLVAGTTYTYDDADRLTDLSHDKGTTNLADYSWTYDTAGRLTSVTNVDGTDDYSYDDDGQLTDVDSDYQTDESYTYDANGNRTNTGYTTGDNNRLTSDGTSNYTYDDEGNRTRKTNISTGDDVEYAWDHRNRLTTVTFRNSSNVKTKQVTYVYDMLDRRIAKDVDTDGNGTIDRGERYAYDGTDVALVYDRSDALVERLLYGPGTDQPLASEDDAGGVLWFLADNQGTVRDVAQYNAGTDTTSVVNHLQYGSFGNITSQTNSTHEPRHTYTGREWDADSDLFYYRARWYDPQAGRFISEDPTGFTAGDTNLSRYVGNNTPNMTDPTGLEGLADPADAIDTPGRQLHLRDPSEVVTPPYGPPPFWDPSHLWVPDFGLPPFITPVSPPPPPLPSTLSPPAPAMPSPAESPSVDDILDRLSEERSPFDFGPGDPGDFEDLYLILNPELTPDFRYDRRFHIYGGIHGGGNFPIFDIHESEFEFNAGLNGIFDIR